MRKFFFKLFIGLFVFIGFFVFCTTLKADTSDVYLIMTNPGEDCRTQMNITWHTTISGTFVEYTTKDDSSFTNKKIGLPVENELDIYDGTSGGNIKDIKCEVTLKDLTPNTEYIYRVGLSNKSNVHNFKTAGDNNFSFAVVSDIHTYSKLATRLSKANSIIHTMEKESELSFVLACGDIMAYGTNRGYWDDFTKSDMVNIYMLAATPGNHDYYNSSANFLDSSYFNAYTNNPDNGCEKSFNTTYYFYYGDVLFISLNSEDACTNSSARSSQREWFEKVLRENENAVYKVVYFHRGMYPGSGSNTGHANTMKGAFQDLIDKYGVDLVFGGHDHVYVRTTKVLNGIESSDTNYGTTYINLPQIGDRASAAGSDMNCVAKKIGSFSGAVLVNVNESSMSFSLFDDGGNVLDSGSISNKMKAITKSKINNGTKIKYDGSFSNMTLTIPEILFQRAYNVKVIDKDSAKELLSIRPAYKVTDYRITGISNYIKEKDFEVVISYRNGTTFTKEIKVQNNIDYGVLENVRIEGNQLLWDSELDNEIVEGIRVVEGDNEYDYPLTQKSHIINLPYFKVSQIKLQLVAIDSSVVEEVILSYGVDPKVVVFAVPIIITAVNKVIEVEIVNSLNIDIPFTYEYDREYIDEVDGKLVAKKQGSTSIVCKNENFEDLIIKVIIDEAPKYKVTYEWNGGEPFMLSEEVTETKHLIMMQLGRQPHKDGYIFDDWYLDKELTQEFDYPNYVLQSDITLYAKWVPAEQETSGCSKASIINLLISLSLSFGVTFIIKKKH